MNLRASMVLALLLASACSSYDSASVDVIVGDRSVREARTVSVGGAATVRLVPKGRSEYSGTEAVTIRVETPGIAIAERTMLSDTWTILGVSPGRAVFNVYVNDVQVDSFSYSVVAFDGGAGL